MKTIDQEKAKKEAKDFTLARFTTAIHYVKQLYTKEEAFKILEEQWSLKKPDLPFD